ncbi:hypothetical protein A2U01_0045851, partial [Trifolium medium]|nr:hypothetical protein [Trifolium medium]
FLYRELSNATVPKCKYLAGYATLLQTYLPSSVDQLVLRLDQMWTDEGLVPPREGLEAVWLCPDHSKTSP